MKNLLWFPILIIQGLNVTLDSSLICEECVCANITEIEVRVSSRLACRIKAINEGRSRYSYNEDKRMCYTFLHCTRIYNDIPYWDTFKVEPLSNNSSQSAEPLICNQNAVACGNGTCRTCSEWTWKFIEEGFNLHSAEDAANKLFPDVCQCVNSECVDNRLWQDRFGWYCSDWEYFSCLQSRRYYGDFWTQQTHDALISNCCDTCLINNVDHFANASIMSANYNRTFSCNLRLNPHFIKQCSHECEMLSNMVLHGVEPTSCEVLCSLSGHHCVAAYEKMDDTCTKTENIGCYHHDHYGEMICECGHPIAMVQHETCPIIREWCETNTLCKYVESGTANDIYPACTLCKPCLNSNIEGTSYEPNVVYTNQTNTSVNIIVSILLAFILLFVIGFGVFDCYFKLHPMLVSLGYDSTTTTGFSDHPQTYNKDLASPEDITTAKYSNLSVEPSRSRKGGASSINPSFLSANKIYGEGNPHASVYSVSAPAISLFSIYTEDSSEYPGKEGVPDRKKFGGRSSFVHGRNSVSETSSNTGTYLSRTPDLFE